MRSLRSSALAVAVAVLAGWSCGGGSSPSTSPSPTPNALTILIVGERGQQSFSPNPATAGGQMVVFRNTDTVAHNVALNDGSVNWGTIQPGQTSPPFRMPVEGTNYHCNLHVGMVGQVNPEAGGPPPTCQGTYCTP
jgi:plastocyanin